MILPTLHLLEIAIQTQDVIQDVQHIIIANAVQLKKNTMISLVEEMVSLNLLTLLAKLKLIVLVILMEIQHADKELSMVNLLLDSPRHVSHLLSVALNLK